jgi:putative endonuclease
VEVSVTAGAIGERIAADYLRLRGYRIVGRNYRAGHLEIDLIAVRTACLAFIEVKTRRSAACGGAVEALRPRKLSNMRKAARRFLAGKELCYDEIRFDLVAIDIDPGRDEMTLQHFKGIA